MGQAKYDNCIMVRGGVTKNMMDNALTTGIDKKLFTFHMYEELILVLDDNVNDLQVLN